MKNRLLPAVVLVGASLIPFQTGAGASKERTQAPVTQRVADPDAALGFWTPARIRAAEPMPLRRLPGSPRTGSVAGGDPVAFEGTAGMAERSVAATAATSASGGQILPFIRTEIEDPSLYPHSTHGLVLFENAIGQLFGCSGTAVASDNDSVVWTAGHCLHDRDGFSRNVVFIPGYEEHNEPYGSWAAEELAVPPRWVNHEDLAFDFGAFSVGRDASGMALGEVVGTRGIAFNQSPAESFLSFGYPASPRELFDGEHLQSCASRGSGRIYDGFVAMGCDMEQGSSGGGWVMREDYVASNQSFGSPSFPGLAFGPYLGTAALNVYDQVRGGTAPIPQPSPTAAPTKKKSHQMSTTLALRKHLVVKGRLTATSGFLPCGDTAPITVTKLRNNVFWPLKTTYTDAEGRYKVKVKDKPGRYLVIAEGSPYDLFNFCDEALSPIRRHRH